MHSLLQSTWVQALLSTFVISVVPNVLLYFIPIKVMTVPIRGVLVRNVLMCFAAGGLLGDVFLHTLPHLILPHSHHDHDHHEHEHEHDHDHGHHHHHHHDHDDTHAIDETVVVNELPVGHPPITEHSGSCPRSRGNYIRGMLYHMSTKFENLMTNHRALTVGCLVLLGFLLFLLAERWAHTYLGDSHSHDTGNDDGIATTERKTQEPKSDDVQQRGRSRSANRKSKKEGTKKEESTVLHPSTKGSFSLFSKLTASGWINLLADSMHNFTDGIAIGAAYSLVGHSHSNGGGCPHAHGHDDGGHSHAVTLDTLGVATALSVLLHEVPHEIGDFIILVRSGLTKAQAIRAQFVTALAAFAGTAFGLLFGGMSKNNSTILVAITAGGFLYISTVGMLSGGNLANPAGRQGSPGWQAFWDSFGFLLGVGMMAVVAAYE